MDWPTIYEGLMCDPSGAAAWQGLVDRVYSMVKGTFWDSGHEIVEDAVADTCYSVVRNLHKARGAGTFDGFVIGCFLNVRNRVIRGRRLEFRSDLEVTPSFAVSPSLEEREVLEHCLGQLRPREQRAIRLKFFEDITSYEDLAKYLGVAVGAARTVMCRALARLRGCVQAMLPGGSLGRRVQ